MVLEHVFLDKKRFNKAKDKFIALILIYKTN